MSFQKMVENEKNWITFQFHCRQSVPSSKFQVPSLLKWKILNSTLWRAVMHCSATTFWRFSTSSTRVLQMLQLMTCVANTCCPLRRCWKTFAIIAGWWFGRCKFKTPKSTSTEKAFVTGAKRLNVARLLPWKRSPWRPWFKWRCEWSRTSKTCYRILLGHSSGASMPTFANCRIACCCSQRQSHPPPTQTAFATATALA